MIVEGTTRATPRVKGNRQVEAQLTESGDTTTIATYAFLGDNRRIKKVVQNCGVEETANDGGNTTVVFYYDRQWRMIETRDGSNQAVAQYCWGTRYTDELIFVDVNSDRFSGNDCDPDKDVPLEGTPDKRYFYHQDRNWNVIAISEYDTNDTNNGRVVERYSYTPYGQFVVLTGDSGSGELANLQPTSTIGSPFAHQGLPIDHEKTSYQNRHREYAPLLQRFAQRDSLGYADGADLYVYVGALPVATTDPPGLRITIDDPPPWLPGDPDNPFRKKPCEGVDWCITNIIEGTICLSSPSCIGKRINQSCRGRTSLPYPDKGLGWTVGRCREIARCSCWGSRRCCLACQGRIEYPWLPPARRPAPQGVVDP